MGTTAVSLWQYALLRVILYHYYVLRKSQWLPNWERKTHNTCVGYILSTAVGCLVLMALARYNIKLQLQHVAIYYIHSTHEYREDFHTSSSSSSSSNGDIWHLSNQRSRTKYLLQCSLPVSCYLQKLTRKFVSLLVFCGKREAKKVFYSIFVGHFRTVFAWEMSSSYHSNKLVVALCSTKLA